jgi:hypothetical protein
VYILHIIIYVYIIMIRIRMARDEQGRRKEEQKRHKKGERNHCWMGNGRESRVARGRDGWMEWHNNE